MVGSWTCELCAYLSPPTLTSGGAPGKGGLAVEGGVLGSGGVDWLWREEYWVVVGSWTCDLCAYLSSVLLPSGGAPGKGGLAVEVGVLGNGGILDL